MSDDRPRASDWTPEQYQAAIGAALKPHDMPAVAGLLRGLAVVDPHTAQTYLDAIDMAHAIRTTEDS